MTGKGSKDTSSSSFLPTPPTLSSLFSSTLTTTSTTTASSSSSNPVDQELIRLLQESLKEKETTIITLQDQIDREYKKALAEKTEECVELYSMKNNLTMEILNLHNQIRVLEGSKQEIY